MSENHVTREELKVELATLELRMVERMSALELRMAERMDALGIRILERMDAQRTELLERIEKSETTLLSEFRKWALPTNARLRSVEVTNTGLAERMGLIEERMNELEQRR